MPMFKSINKKISSIFISLSILFFLSYYLTQYFHNKTHTGPVETEILSKRIDYQAVSLLKLMGDTKDILTENSNNYWQKLDSIFYKNQYVCFITKYDSINYWNTSKVSVLAFSDLILDNSIHVINLPSGWYLYTAASIQNYNIYILSLIKADFQVNNNLLNPEFSTEYSICPDLDLTLNAEEASHIIYNTNRQFLLGTTYKADQGGSNNINSTIFILFFLAYLFLIMFLFRSITNSKFSIRKPILGFMSFIIIVALIRIFDIYFHFPSELKSTQIFSNNIFVIPFTASIGDLIINTALLIIFSFSSFRFFSRNIMRPSIVKIIVKYSILWAYILVILFVIYHTIYDQNISFFSESLLNNYNLFISVLVIIGLNISLYFAFVTYLASSKDEIVPFFIPFLISLVGIFLTYFLSDIPLVLLIITLIITFILITTKQTIWKYTTDLFLNHLVLLVLLAIVTSVIISNSYKLKNEKYQEFIAQTLTITSDSIFEYSFDNIVKKVKNDKLITQLLFTDTVATDANLEEYIRSNYFNEYLDKYNIQITNCVEDELLEIQPAGEIHDCADYFNSLIEEATIPVLDSFLFRFNLGTESIYYISRFSFINPDNPSRIRNIFIEFVSSHVPEGLGYPELLIDKRSNTLSLSEYTFAIYSNNHLTYKFGDFPYSTYLSPEKSFQLETHYDYNNFHHYAMLISPDNYLIVSREKTSTTMTIVLFSSIFILLSLISIVVYITVYARRAINLFRVNFKTRLQSFVIATLTLTFVLMAITTFIYIQDSSRETLEKQLTEKTNSVLIELQHKLSAVTNLQSQDVDFLHQLLRKFSLVFFSDINLYDQSGYLIATSRPEIFEKNLLSTYINPKAYKAIFFDNKLNFITEEKIGALKYYSSYAPITLNNDFPIGAVNLPYFARQTEFTKSYYIMLSYLINIYVIIGIIGALIAIIFSRYLTRPLVLLQKSLATIRIDKHNEKIQWTKNDEIGMLINEYNRMVDKLEQSTELLKHSERESAWREVARQIAHEIKNPLTPMKLNVQYLEKSFKNKDPEFASKICSISTSLIQQIDTLNNVAEMFSDFAKTKSLDFLQVNLNSVISSSVNLFNKNTNVSISTTYAEPENDLFTLGFEKDILRVINNVIKNAIQSVEKNEKAKIMISVVRKSKFITVAVTDNGIGISEEMKSKIFHPYFTTRTSGTGLGLAIVKNIMNEIGGEVHFESDINKGTTFFLIFPDAS